MENNEKSKAGEIQIIDDKEEEEEGIVDEEAFKVLGSLFDKENDVDD
ncbi:Uncharacterized protein dnl_62440 [Desulfonema limicola]|uniref:Uncharacterized protein n=1 Tax=Desulfonema limicola TaxID=45656 RepID=A0A975BED4_9BACT|nr:hypothetical protein [Desulfonema limicola]QTA83826.1 Uncharacterized protein dnl_62440 [Desulfonema limicola]